MKKFLGLICGLFLLFGCAITTADVKESLDCKPWKLQIQGELYDGPCAGDLWTEPTNGSKWFAVGIVHSKQYPVIAVFWDFREPRDCVADIGNIYYDMGDGSYVLAGATEVADLLNQITEAGELDLIQWAECSKK